MHVHSDELISEQVQGGLYLQAFIRMCAIGMLMGLYATFLALIASKTSKSKPIVQAIIPAIGVVMVISLQISFAWSFIVLQYCWMSDFKSTYQVICIALVLVFISCIASTIEREIARSHRHQHSHGHNHDHSHQHSDCCHHDHNSIISCLLYTSPSPRDQRGSRMPSSA